MCPASIERKVVFGSFRLPHFQNQVNERMREAFYSYLDKEVIPLLEGDIVRIEGRVFSHYDQPEYAGLAEVKHRFYYEISLTSNAGIEDAWGEVDYHSDTATYVPKRIKPPNVKTLLEKRKIEQKRQAELEFKQRHLHHSGDYCPQCQSTRVARLVYGNIVLNADLQADLAAGRIRLGGCCISDDSPRWSCLSCGSQWGLSASKKAWRQFLRLLKDIEKKQKKRERLSPSAL